MSATIQPVTADELFMMKDDGFRYDLVKGELRKMSPAGGEHGIIIGRLTTALGHYVEENDLGEHGVIFAVSVLVPSNLLRKGRDPRYRPLRKNLRQASRRCGDVED